MNPGDEIKPGQQDSPATQHVSENQESGLNQQPQQSNNPTEATSSNSENTQPVAGEQMATPIPSSEPMTPQPTSSSPAAHPNETAPSVTPQIVQPASNFNTNASTNSNAAAANSTPSSQPTMSGSQFAQSQSKKGHKRILTIVAVVFAGILLVGGGVLAYFAVVVQNRPENVMKQALANMLDTETIKSAGFEGEINFAGDDMPEGLGATIFEGAVNENRAFQFSSRTDLTGTGITVDIRRPENKEVYAKLGGLGGLEQLVREFYRGILERALGPGDPRLNGPEMEQQLDIVVGPTVDLLDTVNEQWYVIEESLLNQMLDNTEFPEFSEEELQKIQEAYVDNEFIVVEQQLEDQDINGVNSLQYRVNIDEENLKGFLRAVKDAGIEGFEIEDADINDVDELNMDNADVVVWIAKEARIFNQINVTYEEGGTTVDARVALRDVNEETAIEKPDTSKSVLELLNEMSLFFGGSIPLSGGNLQSSANPEPLCNDAYAYALNTGDYSAIPSECEDELPTQTLGAFDVNSIFQP